MKVAKINLNISDTKFSPQDKIKGICEWERDVIDSNILSIKLMIYTRRRKTDIFNNAMIVEELIFNNTNQTGTTEFVLTLPEFPYSFEGNLFILYYAVEAIIENGPHAQVIIECNK